MKIKEQCKGMVRFFEREKMDYALIGAFALHAYGYTRTTKDIDFVLRKKHQEKVISFLESLGYETLNQSDGYSNHLHKLNTARVDFVYVDDKSAEILFKQSQVKSLFEDVSITVVSPEHLVALKLHSAKNAPERLYREISDIQELYRVTAMESHIIKYYLEKYDLMAHYKAIVGES